MSSATAWPPKFIGHRFPLITLRGANIRFTSFDLFIPDCPKLAAPPPPASCASIPFTSIDICPNWFSCKEVLYDKDSSPLNTARKMKGRSLEVRCLWSADPYDWLGFKLWWLELTEHKTLRCAKVQSTGGIFQLMGIRLDELSQRSIHRSECWRKWQLLRLSQCAFCAFIFLLIKFISSLTLNACSSNNFFQC